MDAVVPGAGLAYRSGTRISATGTSSQPACSKEAWYGWWRIAKAPMWTPRTRLRMTAYHSVEASSGPWMRCQGSSGGRSAAASPASISCPKVAI